MRLDMKKINKILKENDVEIEDISSDSNIESPFDPKKIDVTTKQMILEVIFRRLRNNEIDMETFFQREMLWDKTKQSRLIESILIRLPLPAFYFDGSNDDKWLIVDGLQRLTTFKNYIIDKNLKLQDLEYLQQFDNYSFDELPRELQRRIEEHVITVYIINPGTPEEVKFNLFRRINTGGLTLTAQEIRYALNQGIPSDFLSELAELDEFKRYKIRCKRMLDKEFVTRFIAFFIQRGEEYKPDLDTFLNASMSKLKETTVQERSQIKADFRKSLRAAWEIFGNDAFRKRYKIDDKKKPLNKALFEIWTVGLAKLSDDKIKFLIKNKKSLNQEFINLLNNDKAFETAITTGTGAKRSVKKRFESVTELILKVLK